MQLKVCGLKSPENIKQIAELNLDYMGFIFVKKSKRFVGKDLTKKMLTDIPKQISKVAVFVNERSEDILWTLKDYESEFNFIQCHGDETPEYCRDLKKLGFGIIKAFQMDEEFDFSQLKSYEDMVDYYLFDTSSKNYGGSGKKFDWELLNKYQGSKPFFLSGGITVNDAKSIQDLNHPQLSAVDINSGFEDEPGLKNVELVKNFSKDLNLANRT